MHVATRRPARPELLQYGLLDEPLNGYLGGAWGSSEFSDPLPAPSGFQDVPNTTAPQFVPYDYSIQGPQSLAKDAAALAPDDWFLLSATVDTFPVDSAFGALSAPADATSALYPAPGYAMTATVSNTQGYQTSFAQVSGLNPINSTGTQVDASQFRDSTAWSNGFLNTSPPAASIPTPSSNQIPTTFSITAPTGLDPEPQTPATSSSSTAVVPAPKLSSTTKPKAVQLDFQVTTPASAPSKKRKRAPLEQWKETQATDASGALVGVFATFGNKNGRQAYSEAERSRTAKTRKLGACLPCKMSKKRCDRPDSPYECCNNCKSRVVIMPCFLAKIIEAQLFRDKPSPNYPEAIRQEVYNSLTDVVRRQVQPIRATITQDFGVQLEVSIALYEPQPGEVTSRIWRNRKIELPPYCIANMHEAQARMLEYIREFRSAFIRSTLMRSNEITASIFDQAQRFSAFNPESLVSQALSLCAACRIIERHFRFCKVPDSLSLPFISDDPENPHYNTYPITPMMDAQLDQIVIRSFLIPIRDRLLSDLEAAVKKLASQTSNEAWFEVFLTLAVLLSHAEWLLDHSRNNAKKVGARTRYNYLPRAESYFHACRIMLAHWHHLCRGASPLAVGLAKLQGEERDFFEQLGKLITAKEAAMRTLRERHMYETELYWCHQLFFPDWKPGALAIEEVVD